MAAEEKQIRPYRKGAEVSSYISIPREIDDMLKAFAKQTGRKKKQIYTEIFTQYFKDHPLMIKKKVIKTTT